MLQHVANETRRKDVDAVLAFWALLGFEPVEPPRPLRGRAIRSSRGPSTGARRARSRPIRPATWSS